MLDGIDMETGVDFLENKESFEKSSKKIVFTGPIDELFNYEHGDLEWRSLKFDHKRLEIPDYQGNAAINYTSADVPYTRIVEHKHFEFGNQDHTVITTEYPDSWSRGKEKYYPIDNEDNRERLHKYREMVDERYILGGRLADYKYYDMHQVVGSAIVRSSKEIRNA